MKEKRARNPNYLPTEEERIQEILLEGSYGRLMSNKFIAISVFLYGALSLVQGAHDAVYPVWMINPKSVKGFEWTQTDVGYLFSMMGPIQMICGHIYLSITIHFSFPLLATSFLHKYLF